MIILSYRVHDTLNDNEHKYIYIYTGFPNQTAQFSKLSNTGSHTYRKKRVRANPCQLPIKGHILDNTFCNCKYVSLCSNVAYIYIHIYIHNCPGANERAGPGQLFLHWSLHEATAFSGDSPTKRAPEKKGNLDLDKLSIFVTYLF